MAVHSFSQKTADSLYKTMLEEVQTTKQEAALNKKQWFDSPRLRSLVCERMQKNHGLGVFEAVIFIWTCCFSTAPVALTQIAPFESYREKEESIFYVSIFEKEEVLDAFPEIKKSMDVFKQLIEKKIEKDQGFAILCNLYRGTHVFLIEKRGNDCCLLFQSYLAVEEGRLQKEAYNFDGFLSDEEKHKKWLPDKLFKTLNKIVSKEVSSEKRLKNYKKVFFCSPYENFVERVKECSYPLVFIETALYLPKKI